jgi:hypothetical protein
MVLNVWFAVPEKYRNSGVVYTIGYRVERLLADALKDGLLAITLTLKKSPHSKTIFSNRILLHKSIDYQIRCALMACWKGKKGA